MNPTMNKSILIFLLLLGSLSSFAQTVRGSVSDHDTAEPLIGAAVIIKGTQQGVITDFDGRFEIEGPEKDRTCTLVFSYISYKPREITVSLGDGELPELDVELEIDAEIMREATVTARKNLEGVMALQKERQISSLAVENLGAREMQVKGLSNVEDGVKKITGVSIASAGQLIVRGLGDRYSTTTLNGLPIASPNPDNKLIPLDLFPASTVEHISVSKVYDAASFADYGGAHININTKVNVPEDFFEVGLNTGGAFNSLGRQRYRMDRDGSLFRTATMDQKALALPLAEFDPYVRTRDIFHSSFQVGSKMTFPSSGGNISMGKNIRLGEQTLSLLASASVDNDFQNTYNSFYETLEATGTVQSHFRYDSYEQRLKTAALIYAGYSLRQSDRIGYSFFHARHASDNYQYRDGEDAEGHQLTGSNNVTHIYRLQNHQLNGLHLLMDDKLELDWGASYGLTASEEPDRRQVMYIHEDGRLHLFKLNRQETMRYFGSLNEEEWNTRLGLKWSWDGRDFVKLGFDYKDKNRDYAGTRFYYNINRLHPDIRSIYETDAFLNQENIADGTIVVERKKQPKDSYLAGTGIAAAYLTADLHLTDRWLVNLGLRYEKNHQWVRYASDGGDWYARRRDLRTDDFFPAVNLKYIADDKRNLRLSLSRTVTRPSFVEMAPFLYQESYGATQIRGNEALQNGYNYNGDLRYEQFGPNGDMLSVTGYFKYLDQPIERIQALNGGSTLHTFRNADNGIAAGLEVELKKEVARALKLGVNASYMYTNVILPEGGAYTNKERSLQGASPILVNADISWAPRFGEDRDLSLTLLYNLQGSRIHAVGVSQLGDIRQQAVHSLDFNAGCRLNRHWNITLQVNDLLGYELVFKQDIPLTGQSKEVERYKNGTAFSLGFSYQL